MRAIQGEQTYISDVPVKARDIFLENSKQAELY